jgi:hypothetical protein
VTDREAPASTERTDAAASERNSQVSNSHSSETVFLGQVPANNVETEFPVATPAPSLELQEGMPPLERPDPISSSTPEIKNKKGKIQGTRPKLVTKLVVPAAKPLKKSESKKKDQPIPEDKNPVGPAAEFQLASSSSKVTTSDKPVTRSVFQKLLSQKEEEEKRKREELRKQQQLAKEIRMKTLRSRDATKQ